MIASIIIGSIYSVLTLLCIFGLTFQILDKNEYILPRILLSFFYLMIGSLSGIAIYMALVDVSLFFNS